MDVFKANGLIHLGHLVRSSLAVTYVAVRCTLFICSPLANLPCPSFHQEPRVPQAYPDGVPRRGTEPLPQCSRLLQSLGSTVSLPSPFLVVAFARFQLRWVRRSLLLSVCVWLGFLGFWFVIGCVVCVCGVVIVCFCSLLFQNPARISGVTLPAKFHGLSTLLVSYPLRSARVEPRVSSSFIFPGV